MCEGCSEKNTHEFGIWQSIHELSWSTVTEKLYGWSVIVCKIRLVDSDHSRREPKQHRAEEDEG